MKKRHARDMARAFGKDAEELALAIYHAGEEIKVGSRTVAQKKGEGHRSVVTQGDINSQAAVLGWYAGGEPMSEVRFICEEEFASNLILPSKNPQGVFEGKIVIFDPVDSTLNYGEDSGGWSVGGGLLIDGEFVASAIYAPAMNGGIMIISEKGKGVSVHDWGRTRHCIVASERANFKQCVVRVGVDTLLYSTFTEVLPKIAANVKGLLTSGSGLLGLAMLAVGRAQLVIQTPQKIWDWAPAYNAVLESGNVFRFFRIDDEGDLRVVEKYDYESFFLLPKTNRLGFLAGTPQLVDKVWSVLPKCGWERIDPDKVSGKW